MNLLEENVTAEDKLLVAFGSNCAGYLNSDAWQGTYSAGNDPSARMFYKDPPYRRKESAHADTRI